METESYLTGKNLLDQTVMKRACSILQTEIQPDAGPTEASPQYRKALAVNLFYKVQCNLFYPKTVYRLLINELIVNISSLL